MTQRFERRRPKGSEGGDNRPAQGPRGGKPSRFSGPRPDWRGAPPDREGREGRDRRDGREGREGRGESRQAERRERFSKPSGEGRPTRVIPARPGARRSDPDGRPTGARPAYGKPSFGRPATGGRSSFGGRPSFGGKPSFGSRPAFGARPAAALRSIDRKPAFGRPVPGKAAFGKPNFERSRFGERRSSGSSRSEGEREENLEPSGESERFGAEPADDMIWGRHSAQAALESERPIHRIWCTPELRFAPRFLQLLREAKAGGVLVEEVSWARLGQLTGGAVHQGIVLQVAAADTLDLASLIEGCREIGEPPLLMAVDGLTDPHNLGAIVRSAEALGAHGLVLPQRRNAGLTGSVAKVAAGALEHLPVAKVVNLNRSLEQLKDEGYRVVGLAEEGTVSLIEADLHGPLVVVTGSESQGLSMLTRKHCDQLIRIPLRGATPSLNASVATALLLYEVARRGWMKTISGSAPAPRIVRPQLPNKAAESVKEVPESLDVSPAIPPVEQIDPTFSPLAIDPGLEVVLEEPLPSGFAGDIEL